MMAAVWTVSSDHRNDILVAAAGTAVFTYLALAHDIIAVRGGLGFDGRDYAQMLTALSAGTAATRLRPLIVLLDRPAYLATRSAIFAFGLMNHVYAFMLWYQVCQLYKRIDPRPLGRLLVVVTLSLCIATSKMFAYYPVLVDLGAYAFIAWGVNRVLRGPGNVTAVAVAAAMLSREFGVCVMLFALHRYLRLRLPWQAIARTCAPGVLLLFATVLWSRTLPPSTNPSIFSPANIARTTTLWNDPLFVGLFLYFAATVFGSVSIVLATRGDTILRAVVVEPEWVTFAAPIVVAAALGDADMWRYLAYLLPAAVVIYAACAAEWSLSRLVTVSLFGLALTLVLQDPFKEMTVPEYFRRWFPYYVAAGKIPVSDRLDLFPVWMRLAVALGIGMLTMPWLTRPAGLRRSKATAPAETSRSASRPAVQELGSGIPGRSRSWQSPGIPSAASSSAAETTPRTRS